MSNKKPKVIELQLNTHQVHFLNGFNYCINLLNEVNNGIKSPFITEMADGFFDLGVLACQKYEDPLEDMSDKNFRYGGEA